MSSIETLPPTISVERAGELLGVSRRSAYRAAARGQIPTLRVGRRLLVPTQRLLDLLGMPATGEAVPCVSPRFVVQGEAADRVGGAGPRVAVGQATGGPPGRR